MCIGEKTVPTCARETKNVTLKKWKQTPAGYILCLNLIARQFVFNHGSFYPMIFMW